MKDWTIIVVEDTYDDRQLIAAILEFGGIEVHTVQDGTRCLKLLDEIKPTIIVTDLAMPSMDGWEMLEQIRANPATATIPVVAISAFYSAEVERDALKAGFDACFPKPVSPRNLVEQLEEIVAAG